MIFQNEPKWGLRWGPKEHHGIMLVWSLSTAFTINYSYFDLGLSMWSLSREVCLSRNAQISFTTKTWKTGNVIKNCGQYKKGIFVFVLIKYISYSIHANIVVKMYQQEPV